MHPLQRAAVRDTQPPALAALQTRITQLFGQNVLPRLARPAEVVHAEEIDSLARMAAAGDESGLRQFFSHQLLRGASPDVLCQLYLTDIARRLGDFWLEDRCTFVEVTLGVILLHAELRRLAPRLARQSPTDGGHAALMLTAPGEQHSFGLAMMAEFFRAGGWAVEEVQAVEAAPRLAEAAFDLIAISVAHSDRALALPSFVAGLRRASRRSRIVVMVGGAAFNQQPSLLALSGADATAPDAGTALYRADALVSLMADAA